MIQTRDVRQLILQHPLFNLFAGDAQERLLSEAQQRAAVMLGLLTLVSLVAGGLITWRYRRQGHVPSGASARLRDDRPSVLTSEQWSELPVSSVMDLDATADDSPLLASDPGPRRRRRVRYKRHRLPNL